MNAEFFRVPSVGFLALSADDTEAAPVVDVGVQGNKPVGTLLSQTLNVTSFQESLNEELPAQEAAGVHHSKDPPDSLLSLGLAQVEAGSVQVLVAAHGLNAVAAAPPYPHIVARSPGVWGDCGRPLRFIYLFGERVPACQVRTSMQLWH